MLQIYSLVAAVSSLIEWLTSHSAASTPVGRATSYNKVLVTSMYKALFVTVFPRVSENTKMFLAELIIE